MKAILPILLCVAGCSLETPFNTPEPRPAGAVDVTMQFCDQPPSWFAYKNEGEDWVLKQVFSGQREFSFPALERVTVVTGFGLASVSFSLSDVVVRNLTADEANAFRCRLTPLGVSQMTGLVQTEKAEDLSIVQFGDAVDFTTGNQSFVMSRLGPGALDLVALNRLFDTVAPPRVIVRSGITVSNSAAFPMLDFAGPEARPLATVKVRHDGGSTGTGFVQFETSRKSRIAIPGSTPTSTDDTLRLQTIPAFFVGAGDLHRFDIQSGDRGLTYWQTVPKDTSVTFGPTIGALTVDTLFTTPVLRPRARFASQSEYPSMAEVMFLQTSSTASRSIMVITSAAYLGGTPTQWELSLPDLRGVIPDPWVLHAGDPTTTRVTVRDARPALYHGIDTPTPGETMRYASKSGQ
jgi:hypothetical protein